MFTCLLAPKVVVEMSLYFNDSSQPETAGSESSVLLWINEISESAEYGWLSLKAVVYTVASSRFRLELVRTFGFQRRR